MQDVKNGNKIKRKGGKNEKKFGPNQKYKRVKCRKKLSNKSRLNIKIKVI